MNRLATGAILPDSPAIVNSEWTFRMPSEDWLSIDPKSCSHQDLVALIAQLEASQHTALRTELQRELINRLRAKGLTDARIIDVILHGVTSNTQRNHIAKDWAIALGLTARELKGIARGN